MPIEALPTMTGAPPVLLLLDPNDVDAASTRRVIREVLARGGRVVATGVSGAALLPDGAAEAGRHGPAHACVAHPYGLTPFAGSATKTVDLTTAARWTAQDPRFEVAYRCESLPVVVTYSVGPGTAVWWASPLPIENGQIDHNNNLGLLLASVGAPAGERVIWDEALPAAPASLWSFTEGTPLHLIGWQMLLVTMLLLFSFGRRSGPLRPDPVVVRAAPVEFIEAMGALYGRTHATNAAVTLAYRGFLQRMERMIPVRRTAEQEGPAALAGLLAHRAAGGAFFSETAAKLLLRCDAAQESDALTARRALQLVRALHRYEQELMLHFRKQPARQ